MLERVGTVEAELVQLQGAIRDHSNESTKVGIYLTLSCQLLSRKFEEELFPIMN